MPGSAFAVTDDTFSSGAGGTTDGNGSHGSTSKTPSYTKSESWHHYPLLVLSLGRCGGRKWHVTERTWTLSTELVDNEPHNM